MGACHPSPFEGTLSAHLNPRLVPDETLLEQLLAQPVPAVVDAMSALEGDIMVLGAGGKMGPSLVPAGRPEPAGGRQAEPGDRGGAILE